MAFRELPSIEYLRDNFLYDSPTGCLYKHGNGSPVGYSSYGYLAVRIDGRNYMAHRIAWVLSYGSWPIKEIDHINGNRADNRISNLREATRSENLRNRGTPRSNKSGVKGVSWCKGVKKWKATISMNSKPRHLGYFQDIKSASDAYAKASADLHGAFARQ